MKNLSDDELAQLIRDCVKAIEDSHPGNVEAAVSSLRDAGIVADMCLGEQAKQSRRNGLLWYAGQILGTVDRKSWYAMNSIINCVDKFTSADEAT